MSFEEVRAQQPRYYYPSPASSAASNARSPLPSKASPIGTGSPDPVLQTPLVLFKGGRADETLGVGAGQGEQKTTGRGEKLPAELGGVDALNQGVVQMHHRVAEMLGITDDIGTATWETKSMAAYRPEGSREATVANVTDVSSARSRHLAYAQAPQAAVVDTTQGKTYYSPRAIRFPPSTAGDTAEGRAAPNAAGAADVWGDDGTHAGAELLVYLSIYLSIYLWIDR